MSEAPARPARGWIGKWIAAVGILHFIAGFFIYADGWRTIVDRGLIAGVRDYDHTATAFWFVVAGPIMVILGALIDWLERRDEAVPRWLGPAMAALLVLLIVPMPATGAWLLVPPVIGLFLRRHPAQ